MNTNTSKTFRTFFISALMIIVFIGSLSFLHAKDTDIYEVNTKQNCYILIDNSASMDFGVYEQTIDYGEMFDYLFTLSDDSAAVSDQPDYIYDTINNSNVFYNNHKERRKIFLWKGRIGVTITTIDGDTVAFTGDAADPNYLWFSADLVDTNTLIDSDGNLSYDGSGTQRLTTDAGGNILFDGVALPLNQDIKLHQTMTMYDGSQVDIGLGGLLNAPGYYFSGYEGVTLGSLDAAEDGDQDIYFFVTGNWVNMQAMYNLHYTENPGSFAATGDPAWKHEYFPISAASWSELSYNLTYPASGNYEEKLNATDTVKFISHPGAAQMQVHFSAFDVEGDGNVNNFNDDYVEINDGSGTLVKKYDEDNDPTAGDGWSDTVTGDIVQVGLDSDKNGDTGTGYTIDKIRITYSAAGYLMQNRLDIAKDALLYVLDAFHGKMNWGYATYAYTGGGTGDGATINSALNPNLTDDANRAAITNHVTGTSIQNSGTPMGEALQDVFEQGYWIKRNALNNLSCRKNYVISVTDGFPSEDDEWDRISDPTGDPELPITDADGDGWTSDPYQPPTSPNYYDDVGHWMYTHSWNDKTVVTDPANSYWNVMTHHIAFGADHPLLRDAAAESGGEYVVAYNKEQLVAAFYSLALKMTEAVSFTSPVVSIDSSNKIQHGDELYLGLFLPQDAQSWVGNIKKYKLGDGSAARPDVWMLYDGDDNQAVNSSGDFLDNAAAFWAQDDDPNDSDSYGSADVREDGVGEMIREKLIADFTAGNYWERPIYTYDSGLGMIKVKWDSAMDMTTALSVADDLTRDKVINYLYGYTYNADAATHAPFEVRDWALGAIVHSKPIVLDYYDPSDLSILVKRYIIAGSNDGMLHVFDDTNPADASYGKEVFAFVPPDILPSLQNVALNPFVETIDGPIVAYRTNNAPKYLIFGERRGGKKYWCLDISDTNPLNWTHKWSFENTEIAQTWAEPDVASIPISVDSTTGEITFKDVLVFTGGYDPEEDNYPEPFTDIDNSGSPYDASGNLENAEWDKNSAAQDVYDNDDYDLYNPGINSYGRGVYVVDIDDPAAVTNDLSGNQILPFSATYGAANTSDTNGAVQTLTAMKFCFPASPAAISYPMTYFYKSGSDDVEGKKTNVLRGFYAIDVYANLFRIDYDFNVTLSAGSYIVDSNKWSVKKIFSANPGSASGSGDTGQGDDTTDQGRKAFYPPTISWGGACSNFDSGNYAFPETDFSGTDKIAALYFGTGDREHPAYTTIRDRFYAVYDDSSVTAIDNKGTTNTGDDIAVVVSTIPYTEDDLLNLTCDELEDDVSLSGISKADLRELLIDDPSYFSNVSLLEAAPTAASTATNEDDAKGWYIVLEDQGDSGECSHCTYPANPSNADTASRDNHDGEKILGSINLYYGNLFFTSYQPSISDPCNPQGNGFAYSLNYCDATSVFNLNTTNDSGVNEKKDVTDRYHKVLGIFGIPSDFGIFTRQGEAGAFSMMGGKVISPDQPDPTIPSPAFGLIPYYWKEGNSEP